MGTRGLCVYKFRGRYYIYYNQYDSYPSGMGRWLVDELYSKNIEAWLAECRSLCATFERKVDEEFWSISLEMLKDSIAHNRSFKLPETGRPRTRSVDELPRPDRIEDLESRPTVWPPSNDIWIEWVYTFDLDREVLSVNNAFHYHIKEIPRDWSEVMEESESDRVFNCQGAQLGDGLITLELEPPSPNQEFLATFESLRTCVVRPKSMAHFKAGKRSAVNFAKRLQQLWTSRMCNEIEYLIPQWTSDEPIFRELCFATACMAAGLPNALSFGNANVLPGNLKEGVLGISSNGTPELVAEICSGFHLAGRTAWCCPSQDIFWLCGVLIYPCLHLDLCNVAKAGIGRLTKTAAEMGVQSFHGIILSLEHVILVRSGADNRVEHTRPLELLPFDDDTESTKATQAAASGDGSGAFQIDRETDAFAAMAHVFEAAELEKLAPTPPGSRLPTELYFKIIDELDYSTRLGCFHVSRAFRAYCQAIWALNEAKDVLYDDGEECYLAAEQAGKQVNFPCQPYSGKDILDFTPRYRTPETDSGWIPIVGDTCGRRALIFGGGFVFKGYTSKLQTM